MRWFQAVLFVLGLCGLSYAFVSVTAPFVAADQSSWQDLTKQTDRLYQEHRLGEAVTVAEQTLRVAQQQFGSNSLELATSLGNLGALYRLQGRERKGVELLNQARAIRDRHGEIGIPLGVQSEAFFDLVQRRREAMFRQEVSLRALSHPLLLGALALLVATLILSVVHLLKHDLAGSVRLLMLGVVLCLMFAYAYVTRVNALKPIAAQEWTQGEMQH